MAPVFSESERASLLEWSRYHLAKRDMILKDLSGDLVDGFLLILLTEIVTKSSIADYRSRLVRDEPLVNEEWIAHNQGKVKSWVSANAASYEPLQSIENAAFADTIVPILWALLEISCGRSQIKRDPRSYLEAIKELSKTTGVPFLFEGAKFEEQYVLHTTQYSIIHDRIQSARDGEKKKFRKWVAPPQRFETPKPLDLKIMEQGVLRIFMSSTFRDMQNERDQFFQQGAVELRKLAKSKGLELVFIDLRWGLTATDSGDGWVVIRCCESIEKCPYFVCFLGARYGWVPDNKDPTHWHPTTWTRFPFLNEMPGLSVTEYEIQYAALIKNPAASRAFFFFRDEDYAVQHAVNEAEKVLYRPVDEKDRANQNELKRKVAEKYGVLTYRGAVEFSELVTNHLTYAIEKDFSNRIVREPEDQAHFQFMQHRMAGFEGRQVLLDEISAKVEQQLNSDDTEITILAAESGIGKSSLMAASTTRLLIANKPNVYVVYHFVGCTNLSNYVESITIRFWTSVLSVDGLGLDPKLKDETYFKKQGINGLLQLIAKSNTNNKFVFLIDAVNQLYASQETPVPHLLTWLPKKTKKNVAIVVSTIDTHESCKVAQSNQLSLIPVKRLVQSEIRQAVVSFLGRYDKKLTEEQIDLILADQDDTGHPLYLRLVLEELRIFGVYEKLTQELQILLETNGTIDLYTLIINRWKAKFNKKNSNLVDLAMTVLHVTRIGLSESELDNYLGSSIGKGFDMAEWKAFLYTLSESLFVRNGRFMYFHQLLVETVQRFYFQAPETRLAAQKSYGMWLYTTYFDDKDADEEIIAETCFHLNAAGCFIELIGYLRKEHVVQKMLQGRYRYEFFKHWRDIASGGHAKATETYESFVKDVGLIGDLLVEYFLEAYENSFLVQCIPLRLTKRTKEADKFSDYIALGKVYKSLRKWKEALDNFQRCLAQKTSLGETDDEVVSSLYEETGDIYINQNNPDSARENYEKSLLILKKLYGDSNMQVAQSLDRLGSVELKSERTEKALKHFEQAMEIRNKVVGADHPAYAISLINIGHVNLAEKKNEIAMENYVKASKIQEGTFGRQHPSVSNTLRYISSIHQAKAEYKEAIAVLEECRIIDTKYFGENHPDVIQTIETIGTCHSFSSNHESALLNYTKSLEIRRRTLGDGHPDTATSLENIGKSNFDLKRKDQVFEFINEAIKIRTQTSTTMSLQNAAQSNQIGDLLLELKRVDAALFVWKHTIELYALASGWNASEIWSVASKTDQMLVTDKLFDKSIEFWVNFQSKFVSALSWGHENSLKAVFYQEAARNKDNKPNLVVDLWITTNKIVLDTLGWTHKNTWTTFAKIDESLEKIKDNERTVELWSRTYPSFIEKAGREHESTWSSILKYDSSLVKKNETQKLLDFWTKMEEGYTDEFGSGHKHSQYCSSKVVEYSKKLGVKSEEKENILSKAKAKALSVAKDILKWPISEKPFGTHEVATALFSVVMMSKKNEGLKKTASDCLTLLNQLDVPLYGNDFSNICAPNANLVGAIIDGSNFQRANLEGCNFDDIFFGSVDLSSSNLTGANLGLPHRSFIGHTNVVNTICSFTGSNGESLIASGSGSYGSNGHDTVVRIWNIGTGKQIQTLSGHTGSVYGVCSLEGPNGEKWIASCSGLFEKGVRIWDLSTGNCIHNLTGHTFDVHCLCPVRGPQGEKWLATGGGSSDKTIRIWDYVEGKHIKSLSGHADSVLSLCAIDGPEGQQWLAAGTRYGAKLVYIWDVEQGKEVKTLKGPTGDMTSIIKAKDANGKWWMIVGTQDEKIRMWDLPSLTELREIKGPNYVNTLTPVEGPNGESWFAVGSTYNIPRIYDLTTLSLVKEMALTPKPVGTQSMCVVSDVQKKQSIIAVEKDRVIRVYDIKPTRSRSSKDFNKFVAFKIPGQDTDFLVSTSGGNSVLVWNLSSGALEATLEGHTNYVNAVSCGANSQGKLHIISASDDKTVVVWDAVEKKEVAKLTGHEHAVTKVVTIKREGKHVIASRSLDNTIRLWSLDTLKELLKIPVGAFGFDATLSAVWTKEGVKEVVGQFKNVGDAIVLSEYDLSKGEGILDGSKVRKVEGGEISVDGIVCSSDLRDSLISVGGFANTPEFWTLFEQGICTEHHSSRILKEIQSGSGDILANVKKFGEELLADGKYKHPQASLIMSACYLSGWGVEKNLQTAYEILGKNQRFNSLRDHAKGGDSLAFKILSTYYELKEKDGKYSFPNALSAGAECYLNGWGTEKNTDKYCEFCGRLSRFDELFELCKKGGAAKAFSVLKGYADIQDSNKKYPNTNTVNQVSQCYLNGWSTEKSTEQYYEYMARQNKFDIIMPFVEKLDSKAFAVIEKYSVIKDSSNNFAYPLSLLYLGDCYANGICVEKNLTTAALKYGLSAYERTTKAFEKLKPLAEAGDAQGQLRMGICYHDGKGVNQNYAEAMKWYKLAAAQDRPWACRNIGILNYNGQGVTKNLEEAARWYYKAYELGENDGAEQFIKCFKEFKSVKMDEDIRICYLSVNCAQKEALDELIGLLKAGNQNIMKECKRAVDKGYTKARIMLALCYETGLYGEPDANTSAKIYEEVTNFYAEQAKNTNPYAYERIKLCAEKGFAHAQFIMGFCAKNAINTPKDFPSCISWYKKAAEQNHHDAYLGLGHRYFSGEGVTKDQHQAFKYYMKSSQLKNTEVLESIQKNYASFVSQPLDERELVYLHGICCKSEQSKTFLLQKAKGGSPLVVETLSSINEKVIPIVASVVADCYANGWGVEQNPTKAAEWRKKAA